MTEYKFAKVPSEGQKITTTKNKLGQLAAVVPDHPIVPFIRGDGIGEDIWNASQPVFDAAVEKAYGGSRKIAWMKVYAGEEAFDTCGEYLPQETIAALKEFVVSIKGPLTTPVGGGFRSLNVTLRQVLDLYACVRPVEYFKGVSSPVTNPEKVSCVIFRENTEDVYCGVEFQSGTEEATKLWKFLTGELKANVREHSGLGIKPISEFGSKRLVEKAVAYALEHNRKSVTLVHKGNIMKFTEGAFANWGYEVAKEKFGDFIITEDDVWEKHDGKTPEGKILIKDRIADNMFQQLLLKPEEYDVLATMNLNGDYLSDMLAAQVGGLGIAPGANIGEGFALFEATHGTAPKYAGLDKVNPSSVILSGVMMLEYMGWNEAAMAVKNALQACITNKTVTYDLLRGMQGGTELKCSEFGQEIVKNL